MTNEPKYTLAEAKAHLDRLRCERNGHRPSLIFALLKYGDPADDYPCDCGAFRWSAHATTP